MHPDSTISVRAAYNRSKKQPIRLVQMYPQLSLVLQNHGYADLKNCYYYFAGDTTEINNGQSLGNFNDISNSCFEMSMNINAPISIQTFLSDAQVSVFLSLYKSSKFLLKRWDI